MPRSRADATIDHVADPQQEAPAPPESALRSNVSEETAPAPTGTPAPEPVVAVVTLAQFVAASRMRSERLAGFARWIEIRGYPPRRSIAAWHALLATFAAQAV